MFLLITYVKKKRGRFGANKLAQLVGAGREFKAEALIDNHTGRKPSRTIKPNQRRFYDTKKTNLGNVNDYSTVAR
jgi:hypothetical protein